MFKFTLRQKILLSYLILFVVFILLMVPFANYLVKSIIVKSMDDQASELVEKIHRAPNHDALVKYLKGQKPLIFFRVGIITDEHKTLYDTHTKRILQDDFSQDFVVYHPEVEQAFEEGSGYHEEYSDILGQKFAYFAKVFDFHGKKYVLRTAFPFQYTETLLHDFEIGFLFLGSIGLLLFSILTWYSIHRITRPIEQIIAAIRPYQEGLATTIPEISIKTDNPNDEFGRLAYTLNSLSRRITRHIDGLVGERKEKEVILESLVEGVVAVDSQMNVTYANNMALQLLGIDRDSFQGSDFSVVNQPKCETLLKACQKDKEPKTHSIQLKKGPKSIYLDLFAVPIKDKQGMVLVLQDKTQHKKILQMRKDFVANASHELKTPITIIMGYAETLHENLDLSKEDLHRVSDKILSNSIRMGNLIEDLLILSDIENLPASRLAECNLVDIVNESRETVITLYSDAQISVVNETEDESVIIGDRYLLELAINNLLNNSAKYSDGPADITATIARSNHSIKLSISDKGIGIPENDIEYLFQRFYTVDKAHSRKMGGSGLGLSIVENIIEKHNGTISVQSNVGEGTTFFITLPINRSDFVR